jgi:hypothetical protein
LFHIRTSPIYLLILLTRTTSMSGVYSRIFAATSRRFTSAVRSSGTTVPPQALWAVPGVVGASWFIWGALSVDIRSGLGLYWDPDAVLNKVEADRAKRLEDREALKVATSKSKSGGASMEAEEEDDDEEEEDVTVEDIQVAVSKAVEAAEEEEEEEEEDVVEEEEAPAAEASGDDDEEEEEEEEEEPKKKKLSDLTLEEKWERYAENAVKPGEVSSMYGFFS